MLQSKIPAATATPTHALIVGEQSGAQALAPPILLQYWQIALRRKWLILTVLATALIGGLLFTLLMTPQYTASARVEISREQKNVTNVEGLESAEVGRDQEFYQTQYSLLEARSVAERVARSLRLASSNEYFESHGVNPESFSLFGAGSEEPATGAARARREKAAVDLLLAHVAISPIRQSALVDVQYTSASPELSARVANAWTEQFIAASMDRRFASTADARKFLEGRLADLRTRLEASERDVVNYASQRGIVALGKSKSADGQTQVERTLVSSDLEALNQALARAIADRIAAESRTIGAGGGTSAEALENNAIASLRQRRAEVAAEYAKLMTQFEPNYPAARALDAQVRTLDKSIAAEESRVSSSFTSGYNEALQREQSLRQQVQELKGQMDRQQRDNIQYNIYQREADTNRELYDGLLQRYKEIGVAGVGANNIAIVDAAEVPGAPSAPNLPLNLIVSLVLGLALAGGITFALEQMDEGLRDPSQVVRVLNIPLLGSVPDLEAGDCLADLSDPKSALSEAYLSVRSSLAFSTDHGVPKSLMVTSTRPAEGKSTTSWAIATVLSRVGKKVLIIDADMRSPSIHGFAGLGNEAGLSNYLAGENDWSRLIQDTGIRGLSLMPAGPMPPSASELLSTDRMSNLLALLLEMFDHVVVDSPPLLGLADAPLLSRMVEGTLFTVEADGVAVRGLKTSLERLRNVNAHILGAVLTKLKSKQAGYGYGYGYSYGYGDRPETNS